MFFCFLEWQCVICKRQCFDKTNYDSAFSSSTRLDFRPDTREKDGEGNRQIDIDILERLANDINKTQTEKHRKRAREIIEKVTNRQRHIRSGTE